LTQIAGLRTPADGVDHLLAKVLNCPNDVSKVTIAGDQHGDVVGVEVLKHVGGDANVYAFFTQVVWRPFQPAQLNANLGQIAQVFQKTLLLTIAVGVVLMPNGGIVVINASQAAIGPNVLDQSLGKPAGRLRENCGKIE
jgi:hypothetical protein